MDYRQAGVNIDEGNRAVKKIRDAVGDTSIAGVLGGIGGFGGLFHVGSAGFEDPVLVSSVDGVGTKLLVARAVGSFASVGADIVNHCVNDILVQGARPLFFMDYVAMGRLDADAVAAVVEGMGGACREVGCALLGGETAEMPGLYRDGDVEIVGSIVGAVERGALLDGSRIRPGDVAIGLSSSGLHTNGYSLARAVLLDSTGDETRVESPAWPGGPTLGEALLAPHRSYLRSVEAALGRGEVHGLAHITGGGLLENIPRVLPEGSACEIQREAWAVPPLFQRIAKEGQVAEREMFRTFNMGVGMVVFCDEAAADGVRHDAGAYDLGIIGRVIEGGRDVRVI